MNYRTGNENTVEPSPPMILRERAEAMVKHAYEMLQLAEGIEDRLFGSKPRPASEKQHSGQGGLQNELDEMNGHLSELGGLLGRINDRL